MIDRARPGVVWALLLVLSGFACASAPDGNQRVPLVAPSAASFTAVGTFLEHRCGTLDCHGQVGRNLRLYGYDGLRLAAADLPGGAPTRAEELAVDYQSVVGLEPEILAAVVEEGGAQPERLTLVRKGRGSEHHKGGALIMVGDAQDRCLTSWLAGAVDDIACADALTTP